MTTLPQIELTTRLLSHLHRGGGYAYLWTKKDDLKTTLWYKASDPFPRIGAMTGQDVYFGVHPTDKTKSASRRAGKADIVAINCLFAEFDAKDFGNDKGAALAHIQALSYAPSVIVDSGGGYHCYWLLRDARVIGDQADREYITSLQEAWITWAGGDLGAKDLARVLRVPGTRNQKYADKPLVTIITSDFARLYELAELEATAKPAQSAAQPQEQHTDTKARRAGSDETIADIKARFDLVAYATAHFGGKAEQHGDEMRIPGNGGMDVNAQAGKWHAFRDNVGGDCFDLVGYRLFGAQWDRRDKEQFKDALREAAHFTGVTLAERRNGHRAKLDDLLALAGTITGANGDRKKTAMDIAAQAGHLKQAEWASLRDALKDSSGATLRDLETTRKQAQEEDKPESDKPQEVARLDAAQKLIENWGDLTVYDSNTYAWRRWTGAAWLVVEDDYLFADATRAALECGLPRARVTSKFIDDVLKFARCNFDVKRDSWDMLPGVYFSNGRLDLETMTFSDHHPGHWNTYVLPYAFDKKAKCPRWKAHLDERLPDKAGQAALAEHIALALAGDTHQHKALVIIGPPRSGKSVILEVARALIGDFAAETSAVIFDEMGSESGKRIARLVDCRLVTIDELPEAALEKDSLFKRMAAHGMIEARSLYSKPFDFRWQAKFVFSTNISPRLYDRSGAVASRLVFVECPNSLLDTPDKINIHLAQEIIEAELPGVARWALAHYAALVQRKTYSESQAMQTIKTEVIKDSDPLLDFLAERCEFGEVYQTRAQDLYREWKLWAKLNGYKVSNRATFKALMQSNKQVSQKVHYHRDNVGRCTWEGIKLSSPYPEDARNSEKGDLAD